MRASDLHGPYIKRNDDELLDQAKRWLASADRTCWISLLSAPGQGNSSLLKQFLNAAERAAYTLAETRIIYADGRRARGDHEPSMLAPIAKAVYEKDLASTHHELTKWWRRFRKVLYLGAVLAMVVVFVVIEAFLIEGQHGLTDWEFWQRLIGNFRDSPIKAVERVFVGVLLAGLFERIWHFARHGGARGQNRRNSRPTDVTSHAQSQLAFNKYDSEFTQVLKTLCRGRRGLVMAIDNAGDLPDNDRRVLEDLFDPPSDGSGLAEFARESRILLITLDYQDSQWIISKEQTRYFTTLSVRPFTKLELRDIYFAAYPDRKSEAFVEVSDAAQQNIHLLFDIPPIVREVAREFRRKHESDGGNVFGSSLIMAYWAARDVPSVSVRELLDWLKTLAADHLRAFHLQKPVGRRQLVKQFSHSRMVRIRKSVLHFEVVVTAALRKFLKDSHPTILARAHQYWALALSDTMPQDAPTNSVHGIIRLKQAAWHASQIGVVMDNQSAHNVMAPSGLNGQGRVETRVRIAKLLLVAASTWRAEGNVKEADDLIDDSMDWIRGVGTPHEKTHLCRAISELWSDFWLGGYESTRKKLDAISGEWPDIEKEPIWMLNLRYEELMMSKASLDTCPSEVTSLTPELQNIDALTRCLLAIRDGHGFIVHGLRDRTISTPEPVPASHSWSEAALWQLRIAAAIHRDDEHVIAEEFEKWHSRLASEQLDPTHLAAHARYSYYMARYCHLLCETWRIRNRAIEEMRRSPARSLAEKALLDLCVRFSPARVPPGSVVYEYLFEEAESYYHRALHYAALLRSRTLIVDITFHSAVLLLQHMPAERRTDIKPWWKTWDDLFNTCLSIHRDLGWAANIPAIHRLRWEFFKEEDRPKSVNDVYNTFQAVRDCHYPIPVVLEWHHTASSFINNYGETLDHRRQSAELHEIWARELAKLPAALPSRTFKHSLRLEQAYSLNFVAQALRLTGELTQAEQILDEVERVIQEAADDSTASLESPKEIRELKAGVQMQRAWLLDAKEDGSTLGHQLIHEIWQEIEPGDRHNANLLGNLLRIEEEEKGLDGAWPTLGISAHVDPENSRLSLPEEWFYPSHEIEVANKFEFRFRQLVRMISRSANPGEQELMFAASLEWFGQEKFPEIVLTFGAIDFARAYSRTTKPLLIRTLKGVGYYFRTLDPDGENELKCLRLLIQYEPRYHEVAYVRVLRKQTALLLHETRSRASGHADWLELARRADYLFGVLVDSDLANQRIASELQRTGQPSTAFVEGQQQRAQVLRDAYGHLRAQQFDMGAHELARHLPEQKIRYVLLDQLECLEVWLRCAAHLDPRPNEFDKRAGQLRDLARQYIGQFSVTVAEPEAQKLAVTLLGAFDAVQDSALSALVV
jgi:hypothetical protein